MNAPLTRVALLATLFFGGGAAFAQTCQNGSDCPPQQCFRANCNNNRCQYIPNNNVACDDGNACTQGDTCQGGTCRGTPLVCPPPPDACHSAGVCDPVNGCTYAALPDGTTCTDDNACTRTDTCQNGACVGQDPVTCGPADSCHAAGTCDPTTGLCSNPLLTDGTPCDDGTACTLGETCQQGVCVGTPLVCPPPPDACHSAGVCDPVDGCSYAVLPDGTPCDDGDLCTTGDVCTNGVCAGPGGPPAPEVTRTLGFYLVHESALQACLNQGGVRLGAQEISTLPDALGLLWAAPGKFEDGARRSERDRAWLLLARQTLVALCNERLFNAHPADAGLLRAALDALAGNDCTSMGALERKLDAFNNSGTATALPTGFDPGPATPVHARMNADDPTRETTDTCTTAGGMP